MLQKLFPSITDMMAGAPPPLVHPQTSATWYSQTSPSPRCERRLPPLQDLCDECSIAQLLLPTWTTRSEFRQQSPSPARLGVFRDTTRCCTPVSTPALMEALSTAKPEQETHGLQLPLLSSSFVSVNEICPRVGSLCRRITAHQQDLGHASSLPQRYGWWDSLSDTAQRVIKAMQDLSLEEILERFWQGPVGITYSEHYSRPVAEARIPEPIRSKYTSETAFQKALKDHKSKDKHKTQEKLRRERHRGAQAEIHANTPQFAIDLADQDPKYLEHKPKSNGKIDGTKPPGKDEQLFSIKSFQHIAAVTLLRVTDALEQALATFDELRYKNDELRSENAALRCQLAGINVDNISDDSPVASPSKKRKTYGGSNDRLRQVMCHTARSSQSSHLPSPSPSPSASFGSHTSDSGA